MIMRRYGSLPCHEVVGALKWLKLDDAAARKKERGLGHDVQLWQYACLKDIEELLWGGLRPY
jgi:hypothetical protein